MEEFKKEFKKKYVKTQDKLNEVRSTKPQWLIDIDVAIAANRIACIYEEDQNIVDAFNQAYDELLDKKNNSTDKEKKKKKIIVREYMKSKKRDRSYGWIF